jgi:hypothetical protein
MELSPLLIFFSVVMIATAASLITYFASREDAPEVVEDDYEELGTVPSSDDLNSTGSSVAVSGDGTRMIVGSRFSGVARVYEMVSGNWAQIGEDLIPQENALDRNENSPAEDDEFGRTVSICGDYVAVGCVNYNGGDGYVSVFKLVSGSWSHEGTKIGISSSLLGYGLDMKEHDGDIYLAIGAPSDSGTGKVYLYNIMVDNWIGEDPVRNGMFVDNGENNNYGRSISLCSYGNSLYMAVGATASTPFLVVYKDVHAESFANLGTISADPGDNFAEAVQLRYTSSGLTVCSGNLVDSHVRFWTCADPASPTWVTSGGVFGQGDTDYFGISISLSSDGSVMAIGAPRTDSFSGAVYVYEKSSDGWILRKRIAGDAADSLGHSVSLSDDGDILVIGAPQNRVDEDGDGAFETIETSNGEVLVYEWA